jgi:aryl-alcohol dehydrogenase-like predicted oxidoreductase
MLRPTWETAVFPLAIERDVGIIAREPLENGLLTGKFTLGTRFPKDDHRHALYHPERLTELLPKVERLKRTAECHGMTMTEMALRYVLSQPAVACVIPGAKRPAQVIENCGPGKAPELDKAVLAGIRETLGELGLTAGKT